MLFRSSVMRPRANTLSPSAKSVAAILMNLSFVFSPGGIRMNTVLSLKVTVTWLPAAVVMMTWRVSGLRSDRIPLTLNAVMSGSVVWACRAVALASNASAHSTRMLQKLLMDFSWLYSQLISAQNQWIAALNEVNTRREEFVAGKF